MKKTRLFLLVLLTLALVPSVTLAFSVKTDNSIYVSANETIEGNFYAAGSSITIDGTINGDIICGARSLIINGDVKGDVICAAQNINLRGTVEGSARLAGESVTIESKIKNGLQFLGTMMTLGQTAEIGWDAFVGAESINIQGKINGVLHGGVSKAEINGEIGKDVRLRLDSRPEVKTPLLLSESAVIQGNLFYTAQNEGSIDQNAVINGEIGFTENKIKGSKKKALNDVWSLIISLFSALIVALVLVTITKKQLQKTSQIIQDNPAQAVGWGAILMLITPLICIILLATIIGIPLSLLILATWVTSLYLSKIVAGIALGKIINEKYRQEKPLSPIWQMVVGVTLTWIATSLPFVGWIIALCAIWIGMGAIWLSYKK